MLGFGKFLLGVIFCFLLDIYYGIVEFCCSLLDTNVSGSPILQNGQVVGAVTHVLVNDPTKGYAIFIENMLEHDN